MPASDQESVNSLNKMLKTLGYSGERCAQILDVTPETVSRWRNGRIEVPRDALACLDSLCVMKQMRDKIDAVLEGI